MRKLIPCLLIAGLIAVTGCHRKGEGAGVVAADDPLTFVPSDTPYVFANIDPAPADVTAEWIGKIDKAGKIGDIYASQLDAMAQLIRDQAEKNADCPPDVAAVSDGPAPDTSNPNADSPDAAKSDAAKPDADSTDAAATAAAGTAGNCHGMNAAQRDKALKLIDAVKSEVAGKDVHGLMDLLGVSPQTHFAVYGIGLVPVLRLELAKPDNLRATIARIETKSGSKLTTAKIGTLDYWVVDGGKSDSPLRGVFAISGKQLVATIAPLKAADPDMRALFGLDKPAKSLAQSDDLAALNKRMGYLTYGTGYFDSARLMAVLKAPPTPLETAFLNSMGGKKPSIDPVCAAEYDAIAATWPRASIGYTDLSVKHMALRGVIETKPDIAKDLMRLRAPMPGMALAQNGLFDFGFSTNLAVLPELATKYADAVAKSPWKCPQLTGLNESFDKSKATLTNPGFAGYAPMFHGLHAVLDTFAMKEGQMMPEFSGVLAIGSDNPASLLAMAGAVSPDIAKLGLKPDGVPKALPPIQGSPLTQPMQAAMTDKMLGVSIGAGEEAKLGDMMKIDPAQQPLFAGGAKGEVYHVFAQYMRKLSASMPEPASKQSMEQQAKMMDMYADWFKRIDVRVELTDTGIELLETVDMQ
jgi:hypothetical protein